MTIAPGRPVTPASIVAARLADLVGRVDAQDGVAPAVKEELRAIALLAGGLDPYLERCATPESSELAALADRTQAHVWSGGLEQEMLSGHVEGQVLKTLVHVTRARRVLEIGMFTGYSALAMAEALPTDGRLVACEIDAEAAAIARETFAGAAAGARIDVRVGPALETLASLRGQQFEFVFIDADKSGYLGYLHALLDGDLLAPHGLVCVDNTLMQGQPWTRADTDNGTAIAAFNDAVAADPRVAQVIVPLRDGLTLIRRVIA